MNCAAAARLVPGHGGAQRLPDSVFPDSGPITDRTFIFNSEVKEDFRST
ncbi:hypothetical protein CHCC5025_1149 [Bacillus licheniformis]|nr:hypothetical protein CHCC5025_1149 [Bacillus licheniformis]